MLFRSVNTNRNFIGVVVITERTYLSNTTVGTEQNQVVVVITERTYLSNIDVRSKPNKLVVVITERTYLSNVCI